MTDDAHLSLLRQRRDKLKLTQAQLGEKLGVDSLTVSRWERGEALPQQRLWPKLGEILDTPAHEIVRDLAGRKVLAQARAD